MTDDGCWEWLGSRLPAGYGYTNIGGGRWYVHRLAYLAWVGPIPNGKEIDHLCRNRWCANPDHLEIVSHRRNIQRGYEAQGPKLCKRGHPQTAENSYVYEYPTGRIRLCKPCAKQRATERYARLKGAAHGEASGGPVQRAKRGRAEPSDQQPD